MKNTKQHFIFDLDDTLTDSYVFNQQMFVNTFAPYVDLTNTEIENYLRNLHYQSKGTAMILQFKEAIDHLNLNLDPKQMVETNEDMHVKQIHKIELFDAVVEVIKLLKSKGKSISLTSNRQIRSLNKILKKHKLTEYFTYIISCSDEGFEKPDPYCLNKIVTESGQPKESFIYFGDSKTDYEFATAAGIDSIVIDHYLNQKKFYKMIVEAFM